MKVLIIRLLEACNAGCFMCDFAFSGDTYRFTPDDAQELCDEISGSGLHLIRFTGGEPLLMDKFEVITNTFIRNGHKVSTISNGWHLPDKIDILSRSKISQVVLSIDGSESKTHDKFRRLPGLFDRCKRGIARLKSQSPEIVIRINSIFGPHNISEWDEMYKQFGYWGVDQLSIIPLKREDGVWNYQSKKDLEAAYKNFQSVVESNEGPRLLGYSKFWAGRTEDEFNDFYYRKKSFTPNGKCTLVDNVRYYTPKEGFVYPCNCVPHRKEGRLLGEIRSIKVWTEEGLNSTRNWLRENGPIKCNGCEPINAAFGEGEIDLEVDPFGF